MPFLNLLNTFFHFLRLQTYCRNDYVWLTVWILKTLCIPAGTQRIVNKHVRMETSCPVTNKTNKQLWFSQSMLRMPSSARQVHLTIHERQRKSSLSVCTVTQSCPTLCEHLTGDKGPDACHALFMATEKSDPLGKRKYFPGLLPNFSSWVTSQYYWILMSKH